MTLGVDCLPIPIHTEDTTHFCFIFKVLSSGDNNIDLKVWTPQANLFYHIQVSASAGFEQEVLETGMATLQASYCNYSPFVIT